MKTSTRNGLVFAGLLTVAAFARIAHLVAVHDQPIFEPQRVFVGSDMYEFDQWAQRIAAGDWLGRTVYHPLNAWQLEAAPEEKWKSWHGEAPVFQKAPFYPYLVAILKRTFGDGMLPVALLQIAASATAVALLALLTARTFGWGAGVCAGLLFALYAPAIHFDAVMLRGPWIVLAGLVVTWGLLRLREGPSTPRAVGLGAAVGLAMLVNEGFSILSVVMLAFLPWRDPRAHWLRLLGGFAGGIVLALSPLIVRNVLVGAPPLSLAVTGGTVYAVFNSAGADPFFFETRPAAVGPLLERSGGAVLPTAIACLRSFSGPVELLRLYLGKLVALVVPFEGPDNANFYYAALRDPLLRALPAYGVVFALAVVGLAMARSRWRAALIWLPVGLTILVSLFLTLPLSRYRATFAVFLLPFAGLALAQGIEALQGRRWLQAARIAAFALAIGAATLLLQRQVMFARWPEDTFRYRPAEFFLSARVYAERRDLAAAARELLLFAKLNPSLADKVNAYLLLAELGAREQSPPVVRAALAGAARLGARDGSALLAVGDAYLRLLHDRGAALAAYQQARGADRTGSLAAELGRRIDELEARRTPP